MPVDSVHPEYESNREAWCRARHVLAGEATIKAAGETYIPKLDSQADDEYAAYLGRGCFYNATARTLSGYLGLIFRKPPVTKEPTDAWVKVFLSDVDLLGTTLNRYARQLASEVLSVGRGGTLVDWNDADEQRAYLAFYSAENILNWRVDRVRGRVLPVLVVLREFVEDTEVDEFEQDQIEQLVVLRLSLNQSTAQDGSVSSSFVYTVEKWRQEKSKVQGGDGKEKVEWVMIETRTPMRRGKPLDSIPFVFHGPTHSRSSVERSPVEDIVTTNLGHFRLDVDYKHGLHFTALPTAWVAGFDAKSQLKIGSTTAWVTETVGATAGFLEFKGQGLETFERAMDRIERLLSVLGSRLLESQKRVSESAEALSIRQGGESSILGDLSMALSSSLTDVLRWVYWWHNVATVIPGDVAEDEISIKLNTDFETAVMTAKDIQSVVAAWQQGAISRDTMLHQFKQGELLPHGRTAEEELALIKADPPPRPEPAASGNGAPPTNEE